MTPADLVNTGETRGQFQVVIAGKSPLAPGSRKISDLTVYRIESLQQNRPLGEDISPGMEAVLKGHNALIDWSVEIISSRPE